MTPKIVLYDIETTPNIGFTWGKYEQNVIEFLKEWQLLSFAFKELNHKKVTCYSRRHFSDPTERALVKSLWKVLNTADVVITHNGLNFDNKKMNAKFVEHGLSPVQPAQQVDTKRIAKDNFRFNSNSLDDLGRTLRVGRKLQKMEFETWLGCMNNDIASFELMERYNKQDVVLLEKVYLKLRPWANRHPNIAQLSRKFTHCPRCASDKIMPHGLKYNSRTVWKQYRCKSCGGYCKGETVQLFKSKFSNL
jgi:DNA polymerase elongation subunit (family B)